MAVVLLAGPGVLFLLVNRHTNSAFEIDACFPFTRGTSPLLEPTLWSIHRVTLHDHANNQLARPT